MFTVPANRIVPVEAEDEFHFMGIEKIENELSSRRSRPITRSRTLVIRKDSQLDIGLLSSFCPTLLLENIIRNDTVKLEREFLHGACLIADISGFVKLCGTLSKEGVDGFDDLQRCTSSFIGDLIKIVYTYGGDVISFAGDAVICFFRGDSQSSSSYKYGSVDDSDGVSHNCSRRAIKCAVEIKDYRSLDLTAHIGVSYGEICFATLGGHEGNWVYLISGDCLTELSVCINDANSGEAVTTPACYEHARSDNDNSASQDILVEVLPSGNYKVLSVDGVPTRPNISHREAFPGGQHLVENIRSFVPVAVKSSIAAGSFHVLSELREVTTMFLKLDSYSMEKNRDLLTLQPFFYGMQQILHQCGGFLRQFLVDDKGCVLIALWGVPKASFPNNCSRAVYCAYSMFQFAETIGETCSVGVTTGNAYCGTVGSSLRQDYVAMGDAVNLAARLMGKAKGRVLVDDITYTRLPSGVSNSLLPAEAMLLKGRDELMYPYYYASETLPLMPSYDDIDDHSIAINKDIASAVIKELDRLSDYQNMTVGALTPGLCQSTARMDSGSSSGKSNDSQTHSQDEMRSKPLEVRFIMVEGAPGMGKSTVADFFRKGSNRRNFRTFSVQAISEDESIGYSIIRKIFTELVGPSHFATERSQRNVILTILRHNYPDTDVESCLREHFPILKHALRLNWDYDIVPSSKKQPRATRFFGDTTLQTVLNSLFQVSCTTIVIEDAHFCDELSMKELKMMANMKAPLLVLCTFRLPAEDALNQRRSNSQKGHNGFFSSMRCDSPGRLKDSPTFRKHFFPSISDTSPQNSPTPRRSTDFFANSADSGSWEFGQGPAPSLAASGRRASEGSRSSNNMRGLYTESASNSHSIGLDASGRRKRISKTMVNKYGHNMKKNPLRASFAQQKNCITLRLPNLSEDEVMQVLQATLSTTDVPDDFAQLVYDVTNGNPYWVKSIAKFVRASGIQEFTSAFDDFSCPNSRHNSDDSTQSLNNQMPNFPNMSPIVIPKHSSSPSAVSRVKRLEHHIVCHLEMFTVQEQTIAKYASIIGDEFHFDILLEVVPKKLHDAKSLQCSLQALTEGGIVVQISEQPLVYTFQNELIRKTLYDFVLPSEAAVIHTNVAHAIEKIFESNLRSYYPSLSYHFAMGANCRGQAFKYIIKAADQSIAHGSFSTGLLYLLHAESMVKYDTELNILLNVAETAIYDMSPKNSLKKKFLQMNKNSSFSAPPPFTADDLQSYEKLVADLSAAHESGQLNGQKIIKAKSRTSFMLPADDDSSSRRAASLTPTDGSAQLLSLPSYSAKHPRNNQSGGCALS
eukprot:CAMPEP_0185021234 /NCGR_PEP_ID=MMETSP1103-20130426/3914_1 /TAXON_ID=36769 /ORGANISM="Paraphysomonas bandaiensis, Strain Caron Lab Isolate" /LENGTH=1311 /DNA_ID=CAMNT_0027552633 /DNA_START=35 /DNA_END=3970 /DNA_ORIENTATION=-